MVRIKDRTDRQQLVDLYRTMLLIRQFEDAAAEQYSRGNVRGFLHLYNGEEAIAAGAISVIGPDDWIITHYRDHGHALARGMDPRNVMAELFGKASGVSGGKGGSMHLVDARRNFMGGYAIVGGHLPLAAGLALAAQYRGEKRVALVFLGDGALNEGEFHETANLASVWQLPLVFFVENNLYGMGAPVWSTLALHDEIYKLADAYRMPGVRVDGMDVMAVRDVTRKALEWCRAGKGPYLVEAQTYRFRGHSMADPVMYRESAEMEEWQVRDPITTFRRYLLDQGVTETEVKKVDEAVAKQIADAVAFAEAAEPPKPEDMFANIVADR